MIGIVRVLTALQAILALRVFIRMAQTSRGSRVERQMSAGDIPIEHVTVLVPVLNEAQRLSPCLAGLTEQGPEVREILVVDGGSRDGTQDLVQRWAAQDPRVRLVDAAPIPIRVNGKAHGLAIGLAHAAATPWILTFDADVRPAPELVRSLLSHAAREDIPALSAATQQELSGEAEGLVHPAMLATLVYRFGIPGTAMTDVDRIQANGQCFLVRRDVLDAAGGFAPLTDSVCEDVTLARTIASSGRPVGFYETEGLVSVEMYAGWRDAWENWSRSLPMRDRHSGWAGRLGLSEVLLVQAAPLWLAPLYGRWLGRADPATMLNIGLLVARVGVLGGMARAYTSLPWTYWLSLATDMPVAIRLIVMWRRRRHSWRGRDFSSGDME